MNRKIENCETTRLWMTTVQFWPWTIFIAFRLAERGIVSLGLRVSVHERSISQVIVPTRGRLLTTSLLGLDLVHVDEVEHQLLLLLAFVDGSDRGVRCYRLFHKSVLA